MKNDMTTATTYLQCLNNSLFAVVQAALSEYGNDEKIIQNKDTSYNKHVALTKDWIALTLDTLC